MQKFIWRFIWIFFVLIAIYHIIVTFLWYWIIGWNSQAIISIIRDALWLIFVIFVFVSNLKKIKEYIKKWKKVWIRFVILMIFSIWTSYLFGQSWTNIMIWIKYWFFYLIIFLTASIVGFVWIKRIDTKQTNSFQYFLFWIMMFWFLRQIMKIIRPDIFMNLWYWTFDNFYFWEKPPIYYLTGYEWTTRWQWIFSWPNNYGYFLIAFLPLILLWWSKWKQKLKDIIKNPLWNLNILLIFLWVLAIWLTLSRAAILWMILAFVLLSKDLIKKHKKIAIWIILLTFLSLIWLSILKMESTMWHIQAKFSYINEVISNPLWHGLWTSWPAVHHEWTMLPENYFIQIMLDIGTVWFIFWAICIFHILIIFKNIKNHFSGKNESQEKNIIYLQRERLYIWWTLLLVVWLFLHVFEDSMVNYLFFISFGLSTWYLSKIYDTKEVSIKKLFIKKIKNV